MQTIINVGDEAKNSIGQAFTIDSVKAGKYGLLIESNVIEVLAGFVPFELPPKERTTPWYNWAGRGYFVLSSGLKIGSLNTGDVNPHPVEHYDKKWERTVEQMRELEKIS